MRLYTLIMMVVLDFSQLPRFVGKLILFISILKPLFGKSCPILIDFGCILLQLAHDLIHKKEIQGLGMIDVCVRVSKNTLSEVKKKEA